LAGTETAAIVERIVDDSSSKGIPAIVLRNRGSSFAIDTIGAAAETVYLEQPTLSQVLVQTVCGLVGLDVPDEGLYAPYLVQIPLASGTDASESIRPTSEPEPTADNPKTDPGIPGEQTAVSAAIVAEVVQTQPEEADLVAREDTSPDITGSTHISVSTHGDVDQEMTTHTDFGSMKTDSVETGHTQTDLNEMHDSLAASVIEDAVVIETSGFGSSDAGTQLSTEPSAVIETVTDAVVDRLATQTDVEITVRDVSRELIEQVVWEVVPELAEALLKEEIARILQHQTVTTPPSS